MSVRSGLAQQYGRKPIPARPTGRGTSREPRAAEWTTTLIATQAGLCELDTVKLDGAWWLVCSWRDQRRTRPQRVIRLTGLQHEEVKGQPYRFLLSHPLPAELFSDVAVPGYHVEELP